MIPEILPSPATKDWPIRADLLRKAYALGIPMARIDEELTLALTDLVQKAEDSKRIRERAREQRAGREL